MLFKQKRSANTVKRKQKVVQAIQISVIIQYCTCVSMTMVYKIYIVLLTLYFLRITGFFFFFYKR